MLGVFFGNIPYNFSTSHVFIHHKLDAGIGDTFYLWDLDRSNLMDFAIYIHRIFLHMTGYSSYVYFRANKQHAKADLLMKGMIYYYSVGIVILSITRSFSFLFWFYFQPLLCMSYFLALINVGFHGFIEYDSKLNNISCVNSVAIIDAPDDFFGEFDHMTHHYQSSVYFKDLPQYRTTKIEEFKKYKASVFKTISVIELSIYILFGLWDRLADYYVDYTGEMTREEIKEMLKRRAHTIEVPFEKYQEFAKNPTTAASKALLLECVGAAIVDGDAATLSTAEN
jgi:hypothetical protein